MNPNCHLLILRRIHVSSTTTTKKMKQIWFFLSKIPHSCFCILIIKHLKIGDCLHSYKSESAKNILDTWFIFLSVLSSRCGAEIIDPGARLLNTDDFDIEIELLHLNYWCRGHRTGLFHSLFLRVNLCEVHHCCTARHS